MAGAATTAIASNGNVSLAQWVLGIGVVWGASVVSYHGILGPTGAIDAVVEFAAKMLAKVGVKINVPVAETDLQRLIAALEKLVEKQVSPPAPVTNIVSVSGTPVEATKTA